jgi:hypothetical protein
MSELRKREKLVRPDVDAYSGLVERQAWWERTLHRVLELRGVELLTVTTAVALYAALKLQVANETVHIVGLCAIAFAMGIGMIVAGRRDAPPKEGTRNKPSEPGSKPAGARTARGSSRSK